MYNINQYFRSINDGLVFQINYDGIKNEEENNLKDDELESLVKAYMEIDSDEETLNSTPFEKLAERMVNVIPNGKIKKRIRREGIGELPPNMSVCSILYSSFLEYLDEPIDYTYIKKPFQFRLGTAVLNGLNCAVASMKVTEKAQFLIHPDYAYGKMGCPPRIPENSYIRLHIELLKIIDSGPALEFDNLSIEDKKKFGTAYKTALGLVEGAKEHFKKNIKIAIRDYNRALGLIEECNLADYSEQEEQQKLKLRILTNLCVSYNKDNIPKKACTACNDIYSLVKNTSLKIPAKVYYQNGLALYKIGDYERSKEKLLQARKIEPQNVEISNLLLQVNEKIALSKQTEKEVAQKFLQSKISSKSCDQNKNQQNENDDSLSGFKILVEELCTDLLNSKEQQYSLPAGLTVEEIEIVKNVTKKKGLTFRESKSNENAGKLTFFITKM